MSDLDYYRESRRCSTNLNNIDEARKKLEKVGLKIPDDLEGKINSAKSQRKEAEKKFSYPYRKVMEATREMREAANLANDALEEVYEFYFKYLYPKACDVVTRLQGNEDIAVKHIKNYEKHSKNFSDIKERRENNEKLSWNKVSSDCDQLQSLLNAFELFRQIIFAEINREEEKKKAAEGGRNTSRCGIIIGVVGVIIGIIGIVVTIIGIKGCSDSSQPPAQPEASVSEAGNPSPNP